MSVKIDHAETWKISYQQSSGIFQKLKTTPLERIIINQSIQHSINYFYRTVPAKKQNSVIHGQRCSNKQRGNLRQKKQES